MKLIQIRHFDHKKGKITLNFTQRCHSKFCSILSHWFKFSLSQIYRPSQTVFVHRRGNVLFLSRTYLPIINLQLYCVSLIAFNVYLCH